MDTFQYAEQAKDRANLLRERYGYMDDNAYTRHLDRMEELTRRGELRKEEIDLKSDYDWLLADAKNEHRQEQIRLQTSENIRRDAAKPRTLRPERYDLDESHRMGMATEFDKLKLWYREQMANVFGTSDASQNKRSQIEAEYDRQFKEIEDKYSKLRKQPSLPTSMPDGGAATTPSQSPPVQKVLKYNPATKTFE
jgi:hypothetical protein